MKLIKMWAQSDFLFVDEYYRRYFIQSLFIKCYRATHKSESLEAKLVMVKLFDISKQ